MKPIRGITFGTILALILTAMILITSVWTLYRLSNGKISLSNLNAVTIRLIAPEESKQ